VPRAAQTAPRLADPGSLLATTHELAGGARVRLRLARPSDAGLVREFLEDLSPSTRERRFLVPVPTVPESTVRYFTYFDPRERMTMAAMLPTERGERIVGLADCAFVGTGLAEIGIVVGDEHQGEGLGSLLSEAVASLAIKRGATHLKAQMLHGNTPMLRLFERLGRTVRSVEDGTSTAYVRLRADGRRGAVA
jgi:RimJ/RimL family protein N-acetyltransferase